MNEDNSDDSEKRNIEKKSPMKKIIFFYIKGVVGQWRSNFSAEQNVGMNKTFIQRTVGTD